VKPSELTSGCDGWVDLLGYQGRELAKINKGALLGVQELSRNQYRKVFNLAQTTKRKIIDMT
jgi:hypothetical protein